MLRKTQFLYKNYNFKGLIMKKLISALISPLLVLIFSTVQSNAEFRVGISILGGDYQYDGQESEGTSDLNNRDGNIFVGYGSVMVEYDLGPVALGVDVVPYTLQSKRESRTDYNGKGTLVLRAGNDEGTNSVQVDIKQHVTVYAIVPIGPAYVKAGMTDMDVIVNDSLASGSKYPNKNLSGAHFAIGRAWDMGGAILRTEIGYTEYDKYDETSTTNSDNKVTADLDGYAARISIVKAF